MSSADSSISGYDLNLQKATADDATVVRCTGRLTNETSQLLKSELKPLLAANRQVILDLTELAYMDSSGLGTLVGLYISARSAKCDLQLVNLSPRVRELLGMTNVLGVFENCGRFGTRLP